MGGKWVRWNVLKMACHRMGAIIGHPRKVSNGQNTFWAEPELDSCLKYVKMSFLGGNRPWVESGCGGMFSKWLATAWGPS